MIISVLDAQIRVYAINIVELNTTDVIDKSGCSFHNWHYMMMFFQFSSRFNKDFIESVCFDMRCIMSLIDWNFLQKHLFNTVILKTVSKITVCDIGSWTHKCQKYIHLSLYLSDQLNEKFTVVHIMCNVHLVDNLQINLLIGMNIIDSECISTDISSQKIIIEECHNMLVNLIITSWKNSHVWWIIWVSSKTVISLQFIQQVMIKIEKQSLSNNKDLIFHLLIQKHLHILLMQTCFLFMFKMMNLLIWLFHVIFILITSQNIKKKTVTPPVLRMSILSHINYWSDWLFKYLKCD